MTVATLSSKFQISIPKDVRDQLDWKAGQKLTFIPKGIGVLLVPVPDLESLRGIAAGADKSGVRDRRERSL
jgi:AbrB family looped-hinge helix DNA binding protein